MTTFPALSRNLIREPEVAAAVILMKAVDDENGGFGATHIVVGDGNVEDRNLASCRAEPDVSATEVAMLDGLGPLSEIERLVVWHMATDGMTFGESIACVEREEFEDVE